MDADFYKNQLQIIKIERDLYRAVLEAVLDTTGDDVVFKTAESKVGAIQNSVKYVLNSVKHILNSK